MIDISYKIHCQIYNSVTNNHVTESDHEKSLNTIQSEKKLSYIIDFWVWFKNEDWLIFHFYSWVKQCMLELHLLINYKSSFAESDNSLWLLEECSFNFLCSLWHKGIRHNTFTFNLHYFPITYLSLEQESANNSPQAKFSLLSSFVNKLWNQAMFICLPMICGCFPATTAELSRCSRDCSLQSLRYLLSGPLQKKFVDP